MPSSPTLASNLRASLRQSNFSVDEILHHLTALTSLTPCERFCCAISWTSGLGFELSNPETEIPRCCTKKKIYQHKDKGKGNSKEDLTISNTLIFPSPEPVAITPKFSP